MRILPGSEVNDTHFKGKTAAGEGRPVVRERQDFDAKRADAVSRRMSGIGRLYGHPVHVALLVVEHGLGPDHAGDRVDGEDIIAVRVSVCSERENGIKCPIERTNSRADDARRENELVRRGEAEKSCGICAVDPGRNVYTRNKRRDTAREMKSLT